MLLTFNNRLRESKGSHSKREKILATLNTKRLPKFKLRSNSNFLPKVNSLKLKQPKSLSKRKRRSIKLKSNLPKRRNRFSSLPSNLLFKLRAMKRKLAKLKSKSRQRRLNLKKLMRRRP